MARIASPWTQPFAHKGINVCSCLVLHSRTASRESRCDVPWGTGHGHLGHCGFVLTRRIIRFFLLIADLQRWRQKGKKRFKGEDVLVKENVKGGKGEIAEGD